MKSSMYNLSFCDDFSYPPEIKDFLVRVLDVLVSKKAISVILSGSVSRGEMSYLYNGGDLKLYSDLEFFVVTNEKMKRQEIMLLYEKIRDLEISLNKQSKFTHIDVSFLSLRELRRLSPKFQFYETKKTGVVLYGKDLRPFFPDKVDVKYVNEASIDRLWSLILYFPKELLLNKVSWEDERNYKYILSRSMLDIPLWILSYEGHFIPNFKSRIDFIYENYGKFYLNTFFPSWFLEFLNECWQGKTRFKFNHELVDMYERVLACYTCAIRYVLFKINVDKENEDLGEKFIKHSPRIFHELILRRKLFELMLLAKNLKGINPFGAYKWFMLHKKGVIAAFLFDMNYALLYYLKKEKTSMDYLGKAENYLCQLDFRIKMIKDINFVSKWLFLRKKYIDFLTLFYRFFSIKREYLEGVIK